MFMLIPLHTSRMDFAARLVVSVMVGPVMDVDGDMAAPVWMTPFPAVETLQPEWFALQPDIARAEIIILVTHEANIFIAIPNVVIRYLRLHRRSRGRHLNLTVGLHNATGQGNEGEGRQDERELG